MDTMKSMNNEERKLREDIVAAFRLMSAVTPDAFTGTEKLVIELFKDANIPYTISHINAYLEGMRFMATKDTRPNYANLDAIMAGFLMTAIANKEEELAKLQTI